MKAKANFHQTLLGKRVYEDSKLALHSQQCTLRYHGLSGESAEVIGAWVSEDVVSLLVRDIDGRTAKLYATNFLIKDK